MGKNIFQKYLVIGGDSRPQNENDTINFYSFAEILVSENKTEYNPHPQSRTGGQEQISKRNARILF